MKPADDVATKPYLNKVLDEKLAPLMEKLKKVDVIMEKIDWLVGKYRTHDEEHTLVNGQLSDHSDRLEKVEEKLGITV